MMGGEMSFGEVRSLATALNGLSKDTSNLGAFRKGTIVSVEASTVTINLSGDSTSISGVNYLDSYKPTVGDVVTLAKQSGSLLILGSITPTETVPWDAPTAAEVTTEINAAIDAAIPFAVTSTNTGLTAATGFSVNSFNGYKVVDAKICTVVCILTRSGADITATNGNIGDTAIGTIPAGYRPPTEINAHWGNGGTDGECTISTAGVITIRSSVGTISNGSNLRTFATFLDPQ